MVLQQRRMICIVDNFMVNLPLIPVYLPSPKMPVSKLGSLRSLCKTLTPPVVLAFTSRTPKYIRFVRNDLGYGQKQDGCPCIDCAGYCVQALTLEEPMLSNFETCCVANFICSFASCPRMMNQLD